MESLSAMFDPKAIALVGATERASAAGRVVLENLVKSGRQKILAVNPNVKEAFGLQCYPSVSVLPAKADLAVIAVRAELVPSVVRECGEAGIKSAVIISTGFGEMGDAGRQPAIRNEDCLVQGLSASSGLPSVSMHRLST